MQQKSIKVFMLALGLMVFGQVNAQEKKEAGKGAGKWIVLFDGTNLDKWRGYQKESVPESWKIEDKSLVLAAGGAGDLITKDDFENFELELEWKISEKGNSGIFFNVVEEEKFKNTYNTGPEMQVLDNERHPDAKQGTNGNRVAGSLYDIIPSKVIAKPAGQWNKVRIVMKNGNAQFFLNGQKAVEFTMWTPEWDKMVSNSKFNGWEGFGKYKKGHIGLQDHGDKVWFRNIRIKEL